MWALARPARLGGPFHGIFEIWGAFWILVKNVLKNDFMFLVFFNFYIDFITFFFLFGFMALSEHCLTPLVSISFDTYC